MSISTQHIAHLDGGASIYVETAPNGNFYFCVQGDRTKYTISENGDSVFFRGMISINDIEELHNLFEIAYDCNN